ncbi:MAG TPA: hypothetical protein VIF82_07485 [Burkholderiaceae bacterium]|jgi:hypothetical protein
MTNQPHDQTEDAAFEDFLQGRGELVKQLKALSQLSPSAALDAAILASAKAAVAQAELSKQVAANDPVSPRKPGFLSRYRMPLAMAASLMVAVLVAVQWYEQPAYQAPIQVAQAPMAEPAPATTDVPQLAQADTNAKGISESTNKDMAIAPPPVAAAKPSNSVAESRQAMSEKKAATQMASNARVANEALKSAAERANAAPTQLAQADTAQMKYKSAVMQEQKVATAPAPASTPAPAAATPPAAANLARESIRAAAVAAPVAAAPSSESSAKTDSQEKQKAWLAHIEELIKANSSKEALAEWEKFEKTYPAYPVPEKLREQIKALKN